MTIRDGLALAQGENCFVLEHSALGERRGSAKILLNGKEVLDPLNTSPTLILGWVGEGLDLGMDRKQHVTPLYGQIGPFPFTGKVILVRIEPGAQASDSYANRPEIASQRS